MNNSSESHWFIVMPVAAARAHYREKADELRRMFHEREAGLIDCG
jgi:hypothetical protein